MRKKKLCITFCFTVSVFALAVFAPSVTFAAAPSITTPASDGGSSVATPTYVGSNVTFTVTATTAATYYIAACKTNAITAHDGAAPTCASAANTWCVSTSAVASTNAASCTYTSTGADVDVTNAWYVFACDSATPSLCSGSSQGTTNPSPLVVINYARRTYTPIAYTYIPAPVPEASQKLAGVPTPPATTPAPVSTSIESTSSVDAKIIEIQQKIISLISQLILALKGTN